MFPQRPGIPTGRIHRRASVVWEPPSARSFQGADPSSSRKRRKVRFDTAMPSPSLRSPVTELVEVPVRDNNEDTEVTSPRGPAPTALRGLSGGTPISVFGGSDVPSRPSRPERPWWRP
jgi:hypothetical protein